MLYLLVFIIFFVVFLFLYGILRIIYNDKITIQYRMEHIENMDSVRGLNEEKASFSERAIKPFYDTLGKILMKLTSKYKIKQLNKNLDKAGLAKNITAERWMFNKTLMILSVGVLFGLFSFWVDPNVFKAIIISVFMMVLVNAFFRFYLSKCITVKQKMILKNLPYTLDLVTVSIEAGLSFDGAIARVINNISGELSDEFAKTLKEIRMGIERKIALKNMSERCEVKEISMLVTSLIQADELGVGLGKVLRIESAQLRERRKQMAREKAMKAPIKMMFPLIFFILPTLFVIILGPAIIQIFNSFLGG